MARLGSGEAMLGWAGRGRARPEGADRLGASQLGRARFGSAGWHGDPGPGKPGLGLAWPGGLARHGPARLRWARPEGVALLGPVLPVPASPGSLGLAWRRVSCRGMARQGKAWQLRRRGASRGVHGRMGQAQPGSLGRTSLGTAGVVSLVKARQGVAGPSGLGLAGPVEGWRGQQGMAVPGGHGRARPGVAPRGEAWRGRPGPGRLGVDRLALPGSQCMAWLGKAGVSWPGAAATARRGMARQDRTGEA